MDLILDIKKYIAHIDEDVWFKLYCIDQEFNQYAISDEGIKVFIMTFLCTNNENDVKRTTIMGIKHSLYDKPAKVSRKKSIWYNMGLKHRDNDLPAIINTNGNQSWYYDGELHRENDLPAIIYKNGGKCWYCHDELHRENDLPAIIYESGTKYWLYSGLKHRDNDLPAIIHNNGGKEWYYMGKIHRENDMPAIVKNGESGWYVNNLRHRENDMPAIVKNGESCWYVNNLRHRENDLPALINNENTQWWMNGLRHRENDLPANIIIKNHKKRYHINDEKHIHLNEPIQKSVWFYHNQLFRSNNIPTIIYSDSKYKWYYIIIQFGDIDFDDPNLYYIGGKGYKTIYI